MEVLSKIYDYYLEQPNSWQQELGSVLHDTGTLYQLLEKLSIDKTEYIAAVKLINKRLQKSEFPHQLYNGEISIYYFNNHYTTKFEHILEILKGE